MNSQHENFTQALMLSLPLVDTDKWDGKEVSSDFTLERTGIGFNPTITASEAWNMPAWPN